MEDFWANLQDSFKVKEKSYSQLTVPQIRDFEIETNLPKELRDDGELLDHTYKEHGMDQKPLSNKMVGARRDIQNQLLKML